MGLETGTDPSDMVATNPAGGDARSTADDHMRLIKAMIKHRLQRMPGAEDTSELTIASGAIVPIAGIHTVDTESDAASDDLDTITATNFDTGSILMLAVENAARVVTIKHGVDNIVTADAQDIALDSLAKFALLRYDGANWNVVRWAGGSIDSDDIVAGAIDLVHMSANSIDSDQYVDGSIDTAHFAAGAVDSAAIATGAVDSAEIAGDAVKQGELNTTTGTVTVSGAGAHKTLPGGQHGFYPRFKQASGAVIEAQMSNGSSTTSYLTLIRLGGVGGTSTAEQTYVTASPPYDLGNGEIPLFIFGTILNTGVLESLYIAVDPPWAYNGPTNITPQFWKDLRPEDKRYKLVDGPGEVKREVYVKPTKDEYVGMRKQRVLASKEDSEAYMNSLRNPVYNDVEITQAIKQSDMGLVPHADLPSEIIGKTVILMGMTDQVCKDCLDMSKDGESIPDLLFDGYLEFGNTPLDIITPPGVMAVSLKWKDTP